MSQKESSISKSKDRLSKLLKHLAPNTNKDSLSVTPAAYTSLSQVETEWKNQIGKELSPSGWIRIDQGKIDQFANLTGDHNWIHKYDAKQRGSTFEDTIAHGLLSLSYTPTMLYEIITSNYHILPLTRMKSTVNYGYDKIRFTSPVLVNNSIRGKFEILSISKNINQNGIRVVWKITIETKHRNTDEIKPAAIVENVSLIIYKSFDSTK